MSKPDARLTAAALVTLAIGFLAVAAVGGRGWNEEAVRFLVRITARLSVVLFLISFAWDDAVSQIRSRPILRPPPNRVHYFTGFAVSHLFHLMALAALAIWFPDPFLSDVGIVTAAGGVMAYAAIFGIAAAYGIRGDRFPDHPLITFGHLYIWVVFTRAYAYRAFDSYGYALIFGLLIAAIIVRGVAFRRLRQGAMET